MPMMKKLPMVEKIDEIVGEITDMLISKMDEARAEGYDDFDPQMHKAVLIGAAIALGHALKGVFSSKTTQKRMYWLIKLYIMSHSGLISEERGKEMLDNKIARIQKGTSGASPHDAIH